MSNVRTYVLTAIFLVVSLIALSVSAATMAGVDLWPARTFTAVFADSNGLVAGDQVRAAGVTVGRVKEVRLRSDNHVDVAFSVDNQVQLTRASTASIKFRSLTGTKLLALDDDGSNHAQLSPGDTIPLTQTDPGVDLDAIFDSFGPAMQGLDPNAINELSKSIIEVFSGEASTVDSLLANLGSVISTLADRDAVIDALITDWTTVMGTMDAHSEEIDQTVVNLKALVHGLSRNRDELVDSVVAISELATNGAAYIEGIRPGLKTSVEQAGLLAAGLNKDREQLKHYLEIFPEAVRQLGRLGASGAFYGLYICGATARVSVPGGTTAQLPWLIDSSPRCQWPEGSGR